MDFWEGNTHLIGCVKDVLIVFCGDEKVIESCVCGLSDNGASMAASNSFCKMPTVSVGDPLGPSTIGSCSLVAFEGGWGQMYQDWWSI